MKRQERDLSVLPRALVRPGRGAQVRAGPTNKNAAPAGAPLQAARDRARHKSRSAVRPNSSTGEHEKRAGTVTGSRPV